VIHDIQYVYIYIYMAVYGYVEYGKLPSMVLHSMVLIVRI